MKIENGNGKSSFGKGISITLSGDELAVAITNYIESQGVQYDGSRSVSVNSQPCNDAEVYVDPSGSVIDADGVEWCGRTGEPKPQPRKASSEDKMREAIEYALQYRERGGNTARMWGELKKAIEE